MPNFALYLRTIIFGITDSFVSTVGFLAGINAAGVPRSTIILTGVVYAFVEAFSMAVGNFLSEESAQEYTAQAKVSGRAPAIAGFLMFFASVLAAFVPIAPYIFLPDPYAFPVSAIASIVALFIAGIVSARFARLSLLIRGLRMALLGGAAIVIGVVVGSLFPEL